MTARTRAADAGTDRLARRYRPLLVTYPRSYRRDRGAELLVATISGLFGAAIATRAAWETAPPLPSRAELLATTAGVLPGQRFDGFTEPTATFTMYGQALSRDLIDELLFLDGGEYTLAETRGGIVGDPVPPGPELVELVRRNLRAQGWTVQPTATTSAPAVVVVAARRGDTAFRLEMYSDPAVRPGVSVTFRSVTPTAVYPAGVAGGLVGAFGAFLMFGWASRRTQDRGPTVLGTASMARHHVEEPHPSWHPLWEWLGQPTSSGMFLLGCGSALVALLVSAVAGRPDRVVGVRDAR